MRFRQAQRQSGKSLFLSTLQYFFKFNRTAQEAIDQIEEKQYALPYANDSRRLYKIGINFSTSTRHLDAPIIR